MNLDELTRQAATGDPAAASELGAMYANGNGVPQNYTKAIEYYQIAADAGDAYSLYCLGYCYLYGLGGEENHNKGIELLDAAAARDIPEANEHMGWLYFRNQYRPSDHQRSFSYMKKAADLGDPIAQTHIAQAYEGGWWGAPAQDYDIAKHYYDLALAQDHDHAQWAMGENYLGGFHGYPMDHTKAVSYFEKAAKNGSRRGQLSLGLCYYNGTGVPVNMAECAKWIRASAEQGNAEAQWRLGYFMLEGIGVPPNAVHGKQWIEKAANQGDKVAMELLEDLNQSVPQQASKPSSQQANSGCYVATAVYGSYDCPPVWTLRRFRDESLASTWCGRTFIRTYYAISPTLVRWFGDFSWFKELWRKPLDHLVAALQKKGTSSAPYNDRSWP